MGGVLEQIKVQLDRLMKAELRGTDVRWVEQAFSPLGPRIHIAAARRRIAEADARGVPWLELGVGMRGKRVFLLTPESVAEELGRRPMRKATPAANDTNAEESAYADFMAKRASQGR